MNLSLRRLIKENICSIIEYTTAFEADLFANSFVLDLILAIAYDISFSSDMMKFAILIRTENISEFWFCSLFFH
jgi:hypothetical protein